MSNKKIHNKISEESEIVILNKLAKLNRFVNLIELMKKDSFYHNEIKEYYKTNKYLLYRIFGSSLGYMHMAISENNEKSDFNYHPKEIAKLINKTNPKKVLELGSGQSANLTYLAKQFPKVNFTGIDLFPSISKKNKKNNISIQQGDYHQLKEIKTNSVDIIYAIETICYSTNKKKIYDEAYRVLKKNGTFVIWDGYSTTPRELLTTKQLLFVNLIENGFLLNQFEYFGNIKNYGYKFKLIKSENMKEKVLPFAIQSSKRVEKYMKLGIFFKIFCSLLPKIFINNLVPIYLIGDCVKYDLACYYELRYRK
jgi:ubiquinone/menaquinone biosynthesis C-methylase UbiE